MKVKMPALVRRFTWLDWLIVSLLMILLVYLMVALVFRLSKHSSAVQYLPRAQGLTENKMSRDIWVDVSGAVVSPGVYKLAEGSRVKDALVAAGGFSSSADRETVARLVNLAAIVTDGQKIYINTISEVKGVAGSVVGAKNGGKVNLNTASLEELEGLSGIGSSRADEVIKNRPYQTIEELVSKKIIPKSVFDKIKDKISVY